ncbi:hypothetical protein [[Phormidium] sp. ETS-05]|uniref:hypothetical protein n=1 Tax=[Phormidium] sp. ETS-05 TaxID=222819 RepID=UPI0018EEDF4F|nr:hypothetical protein [[Phormidium] sp. ETS-05]
MGIRQTAKPTFDALEPGRCSGKDLLPLGQQMLCPRSALALGNANFSDNLSLLRLAACSEVSLASSLVCWGGEISDRHHI